MAYNPINYTAGSADTLPAGAAKINGMFSELYAGEANGATIIQSSTQPLTGPIGQLWMNTATSPPTLYRCNSIFPAVLYGPVLAPAAKTRTILIGDSLLARAFGSPGSNNPNGFIVSGGIATINCSTSLGSNGLFAPGNYVQLYNPGDTGFTNPMNGANVPILTAPTNVSFTCSATIPGIGTLADGNYSTIAGNVWSVVPMNNGFNGSWFTWLNAYLGSPFQVVATYAVGGTLTSFALAMMPQALAGPKFDFAVIQSGTNDIDTAGTAAAANAAAITALANILSMASSVLAYGATPIIGVPPPVASGRAGAKYKNIALAQLRYGLVKAVRANNQIILVDLYKHCILGTAANGGYVSGYVDTSDNIHPTVTASIAIAKAEILWQSGRYPIPPDFQPVWIGDDYYDDTADHSGAPYPNLLQNGGFNGTAGTVGSPATGTVANSWNLNSVTGGITCAAVGQAARTAGYGGSADPNTSNWGYAQTVSASGSAASQGYILTSAAQNLVAGHWYRCGLTVKALATLAHIQGVELQVFDVTTGANTYFGQITDTADLGAMNMVSGDEVQFVTQPFYMANADSILLQILVFSSAAGWSANLEFSSCWIRQIDSPYA